MMPRRMIGQGWAMRGTGRFRLGFRNWRRAYPNLGEATISTINPATCVLRAACCVLPTLSKSSIERVAFRSSLIGCSTFWILRVDLYRGAET